MVFKGTCWRNFVFWVRVGVGKGRKNERGNSGLLIKS